MATARGEGDLLLHRQLEVERGHVSEGRQLRQGSEGGQRERRRVERWRGDGGGRRRKRPHRRRSTAGRKGAG